MNCRPSWRRRRRKRPRAPPNNELAPLVGAPLRHHHGSINHGRAGAARARALVGQPASDGNKKPNGAPTQSGQVAPVPVPATAPASLPWAEAHSVNNGRPISLANNRPCRLVIGQSGRLCRQQRPQRGEARRDQFGCDGMRFDLI